MPRAWAVLLLATLSCNDPSAPPPPPSFNLTPLAQWSGGQIVISSPLFSGAGTLPAIEASGVPMSLLRLDDSTLQATLPSLPSQDAAITVIRNGEVYSAGAVTVAGFRRRRNVSPGFVGEPVLGTFAGGPYLIAGQYAQHSGGSITVVDIGQAAQRVEIGVQQPDASRGHGVGVSYNPFNVILRDSTGALGEWQVFPTLAWVDTVATYPFFTRSMARLSSTVWLVTENHQTQILRSTAPDIQVQIEDPFRFHLSTALDRAILSAGYQEGAVVFAMSTGDTVYRLPFNFVGGAAFDETGGILYVLARQGFAFDNPVLLAVDAGTGSVRNQLALPHNLETGWLVFRPGTPGIILVGVTDNGVQGLLIVDAEGFQIAGRLLVPGSVACTDINCSLFSSTLAADNRTAWLVSPGEPALIWEFDLLPAE